MCRPGTPASSTVGTSGAVAVRLSAIAANTLMWPARNCGSAVTGSTIAMSICPPTRSGMIGAVPR